MRLITTLLIAILMLTIVILFMVKMIFDYVTHDKTKPQTYYKKWKTPPKFEHKGINTNCVAIPACLLKNERCIECRHWSYGKDICNLHDMGMMADDYCSYWERK